MDILHLVDRLEETIKESSRFFFGSSRMRGVTSGRRGSTWSSLLTL